MLEVLTSTEFRDERGTITTFLCEPIVEYNLVTLRAGMVRGLHWHPHFTEYLLFVSGTGMLDSRHVYGGDTTTLPIAPGLSTRAVPGIAHAVRAETDLTFVALLTRRWDDFDPPIVRCDV